ncbi:putative transcription factor ILR3 [Helianthus annuus]|nr:putative transcription factor ILR3 [Helianthus annuus]
MRCELTSKMLLELSSTLEPCRPATTYKLAIPGDVVRVMNQLKSDSHDCKEMNEKLSEEIKTLKSDNQAQPSSKKKKKNAAALLCFISLVNGSNYVTVYVLFV